MKYFVLRYEVVENFGERRTPLREEHLKLVREAHARGDIVMAGAVGNPPEGALVVFRSESVSTAENFARSDPYVTRGLVTRWTVQPWNVVVGQ